MEYLTTLLNNTTQHIKRNYTRKPLANSRNLCICVLISFIVICGLYFMTFLQKPSNYSIKPVYGYFSGYIGKASDEIRPTGLVLNTNDKNRLPRKYAVISTSTPDFITSKVPNYNYVFYAPLTSLAWQRIGYQTILLIAGNRSDWNRYDCLHIVTNYLDRTNTTYVFLNPPTQNKVMISQTSRLFAATLVPNLQEQDYLLTSDVDLWPFYAEPYALPHEKSLLSQNAFCCGLFNVNGTKVRELPISNIGAHVKTWKDVLSMGNRTLPNTAEGILKYFKKAFGNSAANAIKKGGAGWYMDQRMISKLIHEWMKRNHTDKVVLKGRSVGRDRIDRAYWKVTTLKGKIDSHLLLNGYNEKTWARIVKLLELMYKKNAKEMQFASNYTKEFQECVKRNPK